MLLSSVFDDKWSTSTMFMMNPSQHNLPHRKFTDGIPMACSYPGPWDTFLTLIENFLVGEYWQVANCKSANWPVKSSSHTVQFNLRLWVLIFECNQSDSRGAFKIYFVIKILKILWMETMEKKMFPVSSSRRHQEIIVIATILCFYYFMLLFWGHLGVMKVCFKVLIWFS